MSDTPVSRALLAAPDAPKPPASDLIVSVARTYGVSPFKQFGQMLRLWAGEHRVAFHEFYSNGLFRPELNREERAGFVGVKGSFRLNQKLSPPVVTQMRPFVRDKVLYGAMMDQLGFPTPRIQAVASQRRSYGNLPTLHEVAQIEEFLLNGAEYPLFVKPEEGSGSVGSALILELDHARRELILSNGARIDLRGFAQEVMEQYDKGFLFQDAVQQHKTLTDMAGQAVGTIRVVTVQDGYGCKPLYTLWKVPSPKAMSDNYWQAGSMLAEIDTGTGQVLQCRRGAGPDQEMIDTHPVSGLRFADMQVPHWDAVLRVTREAHNLLPQFGVFGWDIAVTADGPVIIECNSNPHHMLYQLATGRGILNKDFAPILDRVIARGKTLRQELKDEALKNLRSR